MACKQLFVALSMIGVAVPAWASQPDPDATTAAARAPEAPPEAKYCLRTEPLTGTRIATVMCLTREEWAEGDVDVDQAWAEDGVKVVES